MDNNTRTVDDAGRAVLTGISTHAFEHPADRAALTALRAVPGFDQVVKVASGLLRERQYRLVFLSSAVRVGERQFTGLHRTMDEVVHVLDAKRPELFVFNDPAPNAMTLGVDNPFIAISSSLYDLLDEDERRVVLGHELGHAMSGHALYRSLLEHILNVMNSFGWIPASGLALRGIVAALREWQRKSELSGDRAGLLASQDVDASVRVQMKLASGAHLGELDLDAFLAQAHEYESTGDLRDGVLKLLNSEKTTHPFSVTRAAEILRWAKSGEYARIVEGTYPHRDDDRDASFGDNAREAARAYRRRIDESTDPLATTVRNIGSSVGTAADNVMDWFSKRTRPGEADAPAAPSEAAEAPDGASTATPQAPDEDDIVAWFERRPGGPKDPNRQG